MFLKQSTASQSVIIGPFVDKTDGNTQETGLTIANTDIRLSKNGGNLAAKTSGGGTHDEEGWYTITLDATDTNTVGRLQLFCHIEASALPVYHEFDVIEEAVYVDMFASSAAGYAGITEMAAAQTDLDTLTAGVTLAAGAVTDASLAGGLEIVFETDFGTNYNTTRSAWVTNGTDFIGTGWNVAKTGYALTTADWNVGKTGYSLTATTGLGAQTANITGNLSGTVGSVTGAVGSVTGAVGSVAGNVDGNVSGSVASNLELGPAEVNAEVVDVLFTDTDAEPAQGLPAATTTLADKIGFLYKAWRNKSTQTATTYSLFNDDAATVDHKATVSDDATTATKGEIATGP